MKKIGVLGVATTEFGELWSVSPRTLAREVVEKALRDSSLTIDDIDALYVGNMLSGILGGQENLGAFFAHELGIEKPAFKVEGACASGGLAFYNACLAVGSGTFEKVLVLGVEKMTDHKPEDVAKGLMGAGSDEERNAGITFPGLYALIAQAHMQKYGTQKEELAAVAVKNHFHASLHKRGHFKSPISIEKVLKSPLIADPLTLFDCSPISDGAAAAIVVSENIAQKHAAPIWLAGAGVSTDSLDLAGRETITSLSAVVRAAKTAYQQSNVKPSAINVAEVHDCFSIAEIIALEDLGFFEKGKAAQFIFNGDLTFGSGKKQLIVNTSGGLKACGHPVGATGVKQVAEVVIQLRGEAAARQVDSPIFGLTHNVGGSGAVAAVHIFTNKNL